jgi:peptide/nickel transport system ATP-binding protein
LTTAPLLEVEGLRVDIAVPDGVLHPVRGIDLTLSRGETLAIVGESGCGKSLTALAVMGLLPAAGRVEARRIDLAGTSLLGLSPAAWRRVRGERIAMIFQDPMTALDPCYRIGDQMVEILGQHRRIGRRAALERARALLDKVGIPSPGERLAQYPHQLSGGLRQRVMIAMALSCEPELLIADEPTTALDVTIQAQILRLLAELQAETGMGLVLITHDLGVVSSIADRVAVMYAGEVVEAGPAAALFARPLHPYAEGLLRSLPIPGRTRRGAPLGTIPGIVPRQVGARTGCGFVDRCPYAHEQCRRAPVPLAAAEGGRRYRCVLPPDGTGRDSAAWERIAETV